MEIKAADVMKLRKMTGAGMMDCKKALIEAEGDYARAQEIIREKGKLIVAKRADRTATEGVVVTKIVGQKAYMLCLACETDFVAQNAEYAASANAMLEVAVAADAADRDALLAAKNAEGHTVEEMVTEKSGQTGEKIELAYYARIEAPYCAAYVHFNKKLGTILGFNKEVPEQVAHTIAMQATAMAPISIDTADCPADILENEKKIAIEKTKEEQIQKAVDVALKKAGINPAHVDSEDHIESNTAKGWITPEQAAQAREIIKTVGAEKAANLPAQMIESIANGRIQKFLKENTLLNQPLVGEKETIAEFIHKADKEATVVAYKRFALGE